MEPIEFKKLAEKVKSNVIKIIAERDALRATVAGLRKAAENVSLCYGNQGGHVYAHYIEALRKALEAFPPEPEVKP